MDWLVDTLWISSGWNDWWVLLTDVFMALICCCVLAAMLAPTMWQKPILRFFNSYWHLNFLIAAKKLNECVIFSETCQLLMAVLYNTNTAGNSLFYAVIALLIIILWSCIMDLKEFQSIVFSVKSGHFHHTLPRKQAFCGTVMFFAQDLYS